MTEDRGAKAIDNTPLAIAKEEGDAAEEARRRPMVHVSKTPDLYNFARIAAKLVFNGCEAVGMTNEEVKPMKERMASWVNIVANYAKDIDALWKLEISEGDRSQLLAEMIAARDEAFVEIFGD